MSDKSVIKGLLVIVAVEFGIIFGLISGVMIYGLGGATATAFSTGLGTFVVGTTLAIGLMAFFRD